MTSPYSQKLHAGSVFPTLRLADIDGNLHVLGKTQADFDWQLVIVYRGKHCPLCTKYLNQLEQVKTRLANNRVDLVAVSADSEAQLKEHMTKLEVSFPLLYGLSMQDMQSLGVYISEPRSEQETDHMFAEPGLFVINEKGTIQVVDISNNPFVRPELEALVNGLEWIRNPDNNYPIRGMYQA